MSYTLAKTAGFCFGVDRAVNIVYDLLEKNKKVATLGPIIHNPQLVSDLSKRGVRIINEPSEAKKDEVVVIRSHGVTQSVIDELECLNIEYIDATCPFVTKIHNIVKKSSSEGKTVFVAGNCDHPEVKGIVGHTVGNNVYVVSDEIELEKISQNIPEIQKNNSILVAQTTYNTTFWSKCVQIAKKHYTNIKIFDTICSATNERQNEAIKLSQQSDFMIIVGGKESSNTRKLYDLCSKYCKTILIETKDELYQYRLKNFDSIGVTAGASTPAYIIKEVLKTMSEILRNDENEDFASLFEESLESEKIYNGKRVTGIVTYVAPNEVQVDIGAKQSGIIPASEYTDDPNARLEDIVKKGDSIELCVVKVNDQEGIVTLSKKRCDAQVGFQKIKEAHDNETILTGVVTDVVRGGILVYSEGIKIFVPASLASDHRIEDLSTLLKSEVKFKVIEVNEGRNRAKGSVRAVLLQDKKEKQAEFWDNAEVGKKYNGEVKSLTTYGAFVDLGGIDGMIHITELSWTKIKHPSQVLNVGDVVEVYIKDLDKEKKRISLGYKKTEDNPWTIFTTKYKLDDVVPVKIVTFTAYGAFAEIIPGVDGLIHISQIANKHVEKIAEVLTVGETVDAKIIEIDEDKKRVSLSMRALLSEEEQKKEKAVEEETVEETNSEDAE